MSKQGNLIYDAAHIIVRPQESDELLGNPGKGLASYQRFNGDPLTTDGTWNDEGPLTFPPAPASFENCDSPQSTIAYFRWYWAHIEPEKGQFRWDVIDHVLTESARRGQMAHLGLMPVGGPKGEGAVYFNMQQGAGVPDWYATVAETTPDPGCPGNLLPIWDSDDYYQHWGDLIRAFGKRYDGHRNLFAVDVSFLDWWGEGGGVRGGEDFQAETDRLIDLYVNSFRNTPLVVKINGYEMRAGTARGCGWRGDSFGDVTMHEDNDPQRPLSWNHMYNYYPMQVAQANAGDVWRHAPVVMEAGWVPMYWHENGFPIDWIIQQGLKYHVSELMLKSSPIPAEWKDKFNDFIKKMGYRFVLRQMMAPKQATQGGLLWYYLWIENIGVAPIYIGYRLAFRLRQGNTSEIVLSPTDIKTWLPGDVWLDEKLPLPPSIKPGKVDLDIGIIDPETSQPAVKFANQGNDPDGWQKILSFDVV